MKHIFYFIIKSRIFILIFVFHSSQNCQDFCRLFCDCCYSGIITEEDIITEKDIITEEDKELTPKILKHLKLNNNNLDKIINEINGISNNIDKINRIIEYSKDIDWKNECCPNTLIRWEKNECAYIAYFHLMLNNPYFLKFFLICDKTMRRKDTYVLNAICECVKWCIYHPSFNKNNMGSVDEIMKAFFRKEKDGEYYYLKKSKYSDNLKTFYYGREETDEIGHHYGSYLPESVYFEVNLCLKIDLSINCSETEEEIKDIIEYETESIYSYSIDRILNGKKVDEEKYKELQIKDKDKLVSLSESEGEFLDFERDAGKCKKILGIMINQWLYHYYAFIKNNNIWYNKNTLNIDDIGQKDRESYMLPFINAISKNVGPTEKKRIEKTIYQQECHFIYIR